MFFLLSIPIAEVFPPSFLFIDAMRTITGSDSFPPSISTNVASFPCISRPWFPIFVLTPNNLTFAFWEMTLGKNDSFIKSPGLSSSIPGRLAFSSQSLTLTAESLS